MNVTDLKEYVFIDFLENEWRMHEIIDTHT
jgi:hypothetical protein